MTGFGTGEVWLAGLDPTAGHEQGGSRPVVIVSSPGFHSLPIDMAMVVPLTGQDRSLVTQPRIGTRGTGLKRPSLARPEDLRSIDTVRLLRRFGSVSAEELTEIRRVLRLFLDL